MTQEVDITFFLLFGVVIVAGGVAIATVLGPTIQRLFSTGTRPMVEARVAMAFRAVRERRRQIGMMRAMGLLSSGVRRWFLTEATFVSLTPPQRSPPTS